ncbi:MAG: hypothetical protein K0R49_305 [Burkholderiales bacterium]|jgi:hypothetical protein|nr:hypothetical protein [Burkholderiales bacterium]
MKINFRQIVLITGILASTPAFANNGYYINFKNTSPFTVEVSQAIRKPGPAVWDAQCWTEDVGKSGVDRIPRDDDKQKKLETQIVGGDIYNPRVQTFYTENSSQEGICRTDTKYAAFKIDYFEDGVAYNSWLTIPINGNENYIVSKLDGEDLVANMPKQDGIYHTIDNKFYWVKDKTISLLKLKPGVKYPYMEPYIESKKIPYDAAGGFFVNYIAPLPARIPFATQTIIFYVNWTDEEKDVGIGALRKRIKHGNWISLDGGKTLEQLPEGGRLGRYNNFKFDLTLSGKSLGEGNFSNGVFVHAKGEVNKPILDNKEKLSDPMDFVDKVADIFD